MKPKIMLRFIGLLLCVLAAAAVGLGIADVTVNYFTKYCPNFSCVAATVDQTLTWVAVGIWGPLPIFLTGLDAIHLSSHAANKRARLRQHSWVSAFIFAPAVIVISCVELGFKFSSGLGSDALGTPSARAWFAVPLTIAILGLLMHMLSLHLFIYTREVNAVQEHHYDAHGGACTCSSPSHHGTHYAAHRSGPAPAGPPCPQKADCTADVDRLNIWAANRWANYQVQGNVRPAVSHYDALPTRPALAMGYTNGGFYQSPRVVLAGSNAVSSAAPSRW